MAGKDALPTVFAQGTERNERIASLLSSVLFRGIRPSFTSAIRRHPLSMWSLDASTGENENKPAKNKQIPIVLFLEADSCEEHLRIISNVLKQAVAESGLLVVELSHKTNDSVDILGSFSPNATVFVIDLCSGIKFLGSHTMESSCIKGTISLDPEHGAESLCPKYTPHLVLVSRDDGPSLSSASIRSHLGDPYAIAVALPAPLSSYGDDSAKSLWIARTALKWMKAVTLTANSENSSHGPIFGRSRL